MSTVYGPTERRQSQLKSYLDQRFCNIPTSNYSDAIFERVLSRTAQRSTAGSPAAGAGREAGAQSVMLAGHEKRIKKMRRSLMEGPTSAQSYRDGVPASPSTKVSAFAQRSFFSNRLAQTPINCKRFFRLHPLKEK